MIKAVIFDLDNTLYDYDRCNEAAETRLLEVIAADFCISRERAAGLLKAAKICVKKRLGDTAASHNRLLYMQDICEQMGKNPLMYAMKFYDVYWDTMLQNMELYDYVIPLLDELKAQKLQTAILTDLTAHIQYRKIKKLGIADRIDFLVTSEEAGAEKPDKRMFERIAVKMGVAFNEAVMVGDSYTKDIQGAKAAGMYYLWVGKNADILEQTPYNSVLPCLRQMIETK